MKFIFTLFLVFGSLFCDVTKDLADAKIKYVQSVLANDKQSEIENLEHIIKLSKQLKLNTKNLEDDLGKLQNSKKQSQKVGALFENNGPSISPDKKIDSAKSVEIDANPVAKQKIITINSNHLIVLDPGHGGKDPGAVGANGEQEKQAVLEISLILRDILELRGYKVLLTRDDDRFINLQDRTKFANKKDAKIFVSIHANAAPGDRAKYAKGIETFFLSPARDERAKKIARIENGEDMNEMDTQGQNAFLNVFSRGKILQSHKLAIDVQRGMKAGARKLYPNVLDGGVREAPFWVLVGAQSAAILVEVGYITHEEESKRLFEKEYQKQIAIGIADGINSYFANNP